MRKKNTMQIKLNIDLFTPSRWLNAHASCAGGREFESQKGQALQMILHRFNMQVAVLP